MKQLYDDLGAFYKADSRRVESLEFMFGNLWRIADRVPWRLLWVQDTGEVYATPTLPGPDRKVVVLGWAADLAQLERILAGWEHVCGQMGSLGWVELRLDGVTSIERSREKAGADG